jgi:hypothetical protein
MAIDKDKAKELVDDARYIHDSLKTYLKDDSIEDSLLFFYGNKCIQLASELFKEVNYRDITKKQKGYAYDLLNAFKEKYPDFEDEFNKQ